MNSGGFFDLLGRMVAFVAGHVPGLILLFLAGLVLAAVIAPFRTLRWWSGRLETRTEGDPVPPTAAAAAGYALYVPGIDAYSNEWLSKRETAALELLRGRVPGLAVVRDAFAYDVGVPGLAATPMGRLWHRLHRLRTGHRPGGGLLANLLSFRNILQVAISADPRYGPIYNYGIAKAMLRALERSGYRPGSGTPVTLIGYSGGGQLVVAAAAHLGRELGVALRVISIGGVISDDPALDGIEHLYHLYGAHDRVQQLGGLLFPGRWRLLTRSHWNRARAGGRVTLIPVGPMRHTGRRDYFDRATTVADGRTYQAVTVAELARLIAPDGLPGSI